MADEAKVRQTLEALEAAAKLIAEMEDEILHLDAVIHAYIWRFGTLESEGINVDA